jgi:arylsulfatase A-like enzyme
VTESEHGDGTGLSRRTFLTRAAAAAATAGAGSLLPGVSFAAPRATGPRAGLNILVVMVDQMRNPAVFLPRDIRRRSLPSITKLASQGVQLTNYFGASNDCTPSRSAHVTGLYTHQTAIFATTPPTDLNVGFPTYGTMLRQQGYETFWCGKWHLSGGQGGNCPVDPYESYGFTAPTGSGTCPSPNGAPGQGLAMDPVIRQEFQDWLAGKGSGDGPWCATVSFVNPHDIAWYPRFSRKVEGQNRAPHVFGDLPANFETNRHRREQGKPVLQLRLTEIANEGFGPMPPDGTPKRLWTKMQDTYLLMQEQVDIQVGLVLDSLAASPFADNTIVVFTADHGEYAGAHGMRGKGMGFYDEAVHLPLIVRDPTGSWTSNLHVPRPQLLSQVDFAPLLLTLASGGEAWRQQDAYAQIAKRASIASVLQSPRAQGRPYIAHATDEPGTSEQIVTPQQIKPAPSHVMGVRTQRGKYAEYSYWNDGTFEPKAAGRESEAYSYATKRGRAELDNAQQSRRPADRALVKRLQATLAQAIAEEIQAPLPPALQPVHDQAVTDWFANPPVLPTSGPGPLSG